MAAEGVAGVDEDPVKLVNPTAGPVCAFGEELSEVDLPWEFEDVVHLAQAVEDVIILESSQVKVQDAGKLQKLNRLFRIVYPASHIIAVVSVRSSFSM